MKAFISIVKALADENRIRCMAALQDRELCVCQLTELLSLAPSTVSKHMSILKQAGLVESRKNGRWVYYQWPNRNLTPDIRRTLAWLGEILNTQSELKEDHKRLQSILCIDPEELCRKQIKS